jgi:hypothetical protein
MLFVTARDAKFFPRQLAVTAGVQNHFDVAAQMWPDVKADFVQGVEQRLRGRSAKQQVQVQFRQRARQRFGRLRGQHNLAAPGFLTVATGQHEQARRGVEQRREPALMDGKRDRHSDSVCIEHASRPADRNGGKTPGNPALTPLAGRTGNSSSAKCQRREAS